MGSQRAGHNGSNFAHTHRGEGRREGQHRGRGVRGQIIRYKVSYKDTLYNTGIIANIGRITINVA